MADQTIPDLPLISAVTDGVQVPVDDSLQTYRATAAQLKAYILANQNVLLAMLKDDIFTGLTEVTPADDDYFPLVDTSDSNKTKKGLVGSFRKAVYRSVTTTDSVGVSDETMKLSGASFTSTLPTAVGVAGKRYKFIHAGTSLTQVYTIATTSGQTIGGVAGGSYSLYTNGEVLEIESDGTNWIVVNHYTETDWTTYTLVSGTDIKGTTSDPTFATSPDVKKGHWKRSGSDMLWRFEYKANTATGSAAGSGNYKFLVPGSQSIDSTKTSFYSTVPGSFTGPLGILGFAECTSSGSFGLGGVVPFDANYVRLHAMDVASYFTVGSSGFALNNSNCGIAFECRLPISGWRP